MNRDLDALIAQKINGWTLFSIGADADGTNESFVLAPSIEYFAGTDFPPKGLVHQAYLVPRYSSDLREALILVQKVKLDIPAYNLPVDPGKIAKMCLDFWTKNNER